MPSDKTGRGEGQDLAGSSALDGFFSEYGSAVAVLAQNFGSEIGSLATSDVAADRSAALELGFKQLLNNQLGLRAENPIDLARSRAQVDRKTDALAEYVVAVFQDPDMRVVADAVVQSVDIQRHFGPDRHLTALASNPRTADAQVRRAALWPTLASARLEAIERVIKSPHEGEIQSLVVAICTLPDVDTDKQLGLVLRMADNLATDQQRLEIGCIAADALADSSAPTSKLATAALVPRADSSDVATFMLNRGYADDRLTRLVARAMAQDSTFDAVRQRRLAIKCSLFTRMQHQLLVKHLEEGAPTDAAESARALVDQMYLTRRPIIAPATPTSRGLFSRVARAFRVGE